MSLHALTKDDAAVVEGQDVWDRRAGLAAGPDVRASGAAADAAVYALGVYGGQVLIFAAGLVQKRLLGPQGTGYWALMGALYSFLGLAPLGVFDGATRQVPAHRGLRDYEAAASVADTSMSFSVIAFVGVGLLAAGAAVAFGASWAPQLRYGIVLLGLTAPLRAFVDCHGIIYAATKRFRALSAGLLVSAVVTLTLQTAFVYVFGFYGMFGGVVATSGAMLVLWRRMGLAGRRTPAFRWRIDRARLLEVGAVGLPIMVFSQIWLLFISIDSLIVARFIDVRSLGFYALAVSVTNYILFLPKSIGAALFPRMQERFAPSSEVESLRHYAVDVQRLLAYLIVPPFIAASFFLVPVLIRHVLPQFGPAVPVVQIMVAGSFLISLVHLPIEFAITIGKRWRITALMLVSLVVNVGANLLAVATFHAGVKGAAVATSLSYLVLLVSTSGYALRPLLGLGGALRHAGTLVAVGSYAIAALWGIELLLGSADAAASDVLLALLKTAVFVLVLAPWIALAQRRYKALETVWSLVAGGARALGFRQAPEQL